MKSPILDVTDVTIRYGRRVALDAVSLRVHPGERLAVVGPNGAGKSTLFKAIAGLEDPDEGEVVVHGHAAGLDHCVAYVPQRSEVDWRFPVSVRDVVMMGRTGRIGLLRRPAMLDRQRVRESLAIVEIDELADRQIDHLSGGQQQRMFIARALAQEALLVLMDEPLRGLDARSRGGVLAALDTLREQGVAVMVATHDLGLAAEVFDRVILLRQRVVADGPPDAVFTEGALLEAYGGRIHFVDTAHGRMVLAPAGGGGGTALVATPSDRESPRPDEPADEAVGRDADSHDRAGDDRRRSPRERSR